ncbi:MAG TPA: hypothetical protein VMF69_20620 [Gemmataceae bacterium]|nr:hypothetical protein [Gemmataceae bacterium]
MFSDMARRAMWSRPSAFEIEFMRQQAQRSSSPKSVFLIGLSVSQGAPSGIAILERFKPPPSPGQRCVATYVCRYLRRWLPPDTAYPVLVADLSVMLNGPLVRSDLIVEAGSSIKPVVSMLRKQRLPAHICPVEVKVSAEDTFVGGAWRVGKGSLIETTRLVLQEERMSFDEQMPAEVMATTPSVRTVYQALLTYPFERSPAANDAFAAREGEYDDLVVAVAMACWYGENCKKTFRMLYC